MKGGLVLIIIGGTSAQVEDLPYADIAGYVIENSLPTLKIRLKTSAKAENCVGIYLNTDYQETGSILTELDDSVKEKITFFNDTQHLIELLHGESSANTETTVQSEEEKEEVTEQNIPDFSSPPAATVSTISENADVDMSDIDTDQEDDFISLTPIDDGLYSLNMKLAGKDDIIAQRDLVIGELRGKIEELYEMQGVQLLEMQTSYDAEINKANQALKELSAKTVPESKMKFLGYMDYAMNPRRIVQPRFLEPEPGEVDVKELAQGMTVLASGAGAGSHLLYNNVVNLIQDSTDVLLVDLSGDNYLKSRLSDLYGDNVWQWGGVSADDIAESENGVGVMDAGIFNDVALLNIDWTDLLIDISGVAGGRDVFILLGETRSFAVRHTLSLLGTITDALVVAECSPLAIKSLSVDLAFIPANRFKVVILKYIDKVDKVLERLASKYDVEVFGDAIKWGDLLPNLVKETETV